MDVGAGKVRHGYMCNGMPVIESSLCPPSSTITMQYLGGHGLFAEQHESEIRITAKEDQAPSCCADCVAPGPLSRMTSCRKTMLKSYEGVSVQ